MSDLMLYWPPLRISGAVQRMGTQFDDVVRSLVNRGSEKSASLITFRSPTRQLRAAYTVEWIIQLSANAWNLYLAQENTYHILVNNLFGLQELHCRANLGGHIQKCLYFLNKYRVLLKIHIQTTCKWITDPEIQQHKHCICPGCANISIFMLK